MISKSLLIPFLVIDHLNSFPCPLLQTLHGVRKGPKQQDVPSSANEAVSSVLLVLTLSGHYVISIFPQHLQHPGNNLGQFKML